MADFRRDAEALADQLVAWRRDLHQHPELGFQEVRTSGIVARHLVGLDIEVQTGVGQTGVVGILEGSEDGPTVLLRFDMDALPIQEVSTAAYSSLQPNVMHACGHDGHTAIGLGVASLLSQHRAQLRGRVKLVFQPAEEGLGGALAMVRDGVLQTPTPDLAFALHLWNPFPFGRVVVQEGPLLAAADEFELTITGRGSHGALPHEGVDAIVVTAQAISALQTVVSRNVDPVHTAVLTVGTIHGGQAFNILADQVVMRGTIRTFDQQVRQQVWQRAQVVVRGVCQGMGATASWEACGCPTSAVVNAPAATAIMRAAATRVVGAEQIDRIMPLMIAEDVSEFLNRVPGCFILLGAGPYPHPHHNASFDFDERALPLGVALLCEAAAHALNGAPSKPAIM